LKNHPDMEVFIPKEFFNEPEPTVADNEVEIRIQKFQELSKEAA
jgi:hypothetical protein